MDHPPTRIAADNRRTRDLREAQDGITNVRVLHLKDTREFCGYCGTPWPCPTWEATETEWERTRRRMEGQLQNTRQQTITLMEEFAAADAERVSCLQRSIDAAQRGHNTVAALIGINPSTAFVASLLGIDEDTVMWHIQEADSGRLLDAARKGAR